MPLPADVLAKLASLSGYDLMLEMDTASRNHGVGLADIESEKDICFAVGIFPKFNISLQKFFDPSSCAAFLLGPKMFKLFSLFKELNSKYNYSKIDSDSQSDSIEDNHIMSEVLYDYFERIMQGHEEELECQHCLDMTRAAVEVDCLQ